MSILISLNVATPFTAATVSVPDSVAFPDDGSELSASVTLSVASDTTLSFESWISTVIPGAMFSPATVLVGPVVIESFVAGGCVTLNAVDSIGVREPLLKLSV